MLIHNITFKIHPSILEEWIKWQREEHIPEIMDTGLFDRYTFYRLLDQDDTEGATYIIQYHTNSRENYDHYQQKHAPHMREIAFEKWGDRVIAFRTLLESVQ